MSNAQNELRDGELTGIYGRDSMDKLSTVVGETRWKEYRDLYDQVAKLETLTKYPIQLDFELNASCNLRCPMCPISAESAKNKGKSTWFDFELYQEIILDGVQHGLKAVKLNYLNEPLINTNLIEFIKFAKDSGVVDIYLSTNGTLLTEKTITNLIASGLTRIQISIDAFSSDVYDAVRPGGDYQTVVDNVNILLDIKKKTKSPTPLVRVNFVPTKINKHQLNDFIEYWKDKVDMIGVQEFIEPPQTSASRDEIVVGKTPTKQFKCSFPFKQLVINSQKEILPCCTFWGEEMKMGMLEDPESISNIWNSDNMNRLREIHSKGEYWKNEICKKCIDGI